jgi:hypothetical protein
MDLPSSSRRRTPGFPAPDAGQEKFNSRLVAPTYKSLRRKDL